MQEKRGTRKSVEYVDKFNYLLNIILPLFQFLLSTLL